MKPIAATVVGGICTSFLPELLVYPAIYAAWSGWQLAREGPSTAFTMNSEAEIDPRTGETVLRIP